MTNKQITALIGIGLVAFSTVLCWPGSFNVSSAFYRAIFINISNLLISELPKFKKDSCQNLKNIKAALTIFGFILLAVGIMNISSDDSLSVWEWVYFWLSVLVCIISIINFVEIMKQKKDQKPKAIEYDPSTQ